MYPVVFKPSYSRNQSFRDRVWLLILQDERGTGFYRSLNMYRRVLGVHDAVHRRTEYFGAVCVAHVLTSFEIFPEHTTTTCLRIFRTFQEVAEVSVAASESCEGLG